MLISFASPNAALSILYGWSLDRVPAALHRLRQLLLSSIGPPPCPQEDSRIVTIGVLRGILLL